MVRIQNEADQTSAMDVDDCTCADLQSHTSSMRPVTLVQSNSYLLSHSLLDSLAISHIIIIELAGAPASGGLTCYGAFYARQ